jgi:CO/xanthine dehydrogenase Mo-binding subunit
MGPTIAAIAGAVRDARGVYLAAMPFTPQAILEAADAAPRRRVL